MWQYTVGMAGVVVTSALVTGSLYERSKEAPVRTSSNITSQKVVKPSPQTRTVATRETYAGRNAKVKADRQGHFVAKAKMNGRRVSVLVDTGATSVAINKSTARRLGISLMPADFKYTVNTANGQVKAASTMIDRIEIGRVSVKNVRAAVLPDKSLDDVLLGMSFLGQLKGFQVRNGELVLTQ